MADVLVKFGDLDITEAVETWEEVMDTRLNMMSVPKRHGALVSEVPVAEPRQIRIKGRTQEQDKETLRSTLDTIQRHLNARRQKLRLFDDRYVYAYKKSFGYGYIPGTVLTAVDFVIDFICDDPFWYNDTEVSEVFTVTTGDTDEGDGTYSKSITLDNAGSAFMFPVVTVNADQGNAVNRVYISSSTLARTFDWQALGDLTNGTGPVQAGNALVADMGQFTIENNGVDDLLNFQGGSSFLWLEPGSNGLIIRSEPATWNFAFAPRNW